MDLENRLIELETKYSYQEMAIEELQKTTHEQFLKIEKLEKTISMLADQIKSAFSGDHIIGPAGEKPPHY